MKAYSYFLSTFYHFILPLITFHLIFVMSLFWNISSFTIPTSSTCTNLQFLDRRMLHYPLLLLPQHQQITHCQVAIMICDLFHNVYSRYSLWSLIIYNSFLNVLIYIDDIYVLLVTWLFLIWQCAYSTFFCLFYFNFLSVSPPFKILVLYFCSKYQC